MKARHALFTFRYLWIYLAGAIAPAALAQTNLLQNEGFDSLSASAGLPPWILSGHATPVLAMPASNDIGVQLVADTPTNSSRIEQVVTPPPGLPPGAVRVLFSAEIERFGTHPDPYRVSIAPVASPPIPLVHGPDLVSSDGTYHGIVATAILPAAPPNLTVTVETTPAAQSPAASRMNDASLIILSLPFQTNPSTATPGTLVELIGAAIQEGVTIEARPDLGTGPDWTMQEASVSRAGQSRLLMRIRPTVPTIIP